jgi:D-sedoheptulose 7-phosphate isomerase
MIEAGLRRAIQALTAISEVAEQIGAAVRLLDEAIAAGGTVFLCGNGGSASAAQHLAAELVGRFKRERAPIRAIALNADTATLTALANDYDFERIFSRQIEALARPGDLLIAISTSGNSPNVCAAAMTARRMGCQTLALTGANGKKLASLCDESILVPAERTARIQEIHIIIAHLWCEIVDAKLRV